MTNEPMQALWTIQKGTDKETLMITIESILQEDRSCYARSRLPVVANMAIFALLCPLLLYCAATGKTPLVRAGFALAAAGTAISLFAGWIMGSWLKEPLPGPVTARAQLQKNASLLSRRISMLKATPLWSAPIFLGAVLIAGWGYQERSHARAWLMWAVLAGSWLYIWLTSVRAASRTATRKNRVEKLLYELTTGD